MPNRLLTTKLAPPLIREGLVTRTRLLHALDGGISRTLTLVSAPAGYGKSTLLSHWYGHTEEAIAWVSVDEGDNDLRRFLGYLVAALQLVDETLNDYDIPTHEARGVLHTVLNDIALNEERVVLVLDDYHLIDNPEVHEVVAYLLEHAPPTLRLLLSTRRDPPLPLPRLRARSELCELRANALRFTPEEAEVFLSEVMHLSLATRDVNELERRTEGWIAGLQLAALSLRGREDVSGFIERFTGTDRFVLDYLTEEVLVRQSEEMQNFLVLTSILEHLTGELCDVLTGGSGLGAKLAQLERDNAFVIPLDNRREWYRYHTFFRDLLLHRLLQASPELRRGLHERAAAWFEANHMPADALRHMLLSGDFGRGAALVSEHPRAPQIEAELVRFLGETGPLETLLRKAVLKGMSLETKGRLLSAFEDAAEAVPTEGWGEPLSERETEVLRLVAAGLPNKAIAKRLDISLNTVKTHTRNINAKLGVRNRTQASARAQELDLL